MKLKNILNYKYFLISNIKKDINEKYKGSILGILWTFINPLSLTLLYSFIFPYILKSKESNYVTFVLIGILSWNYFSRGILNSTKTIIVNRDLLKKVYFPKIILPLTTCITELINFLISASIIFLFIIFNNIGFSIHVLIFPIIIIIQFILILGISLITSSINVFFRDIENITDFILKLIYYITPVFYATDLIKGTKFEILFNINPMTIIVNSYRDILINHANPNFINLLLVLIFSLLILFLGIFIFKKLEPKFVEEL